MLTADRSRIEAFPSYQVLYLAIELYLKSFLALKGMSRQEVTSFNHFLDKLLVECRSRGLPANSHLDELIDWLVLDDPKGLGLRYPDFTLEDQIDPEDCAEVLTSLRFAIDAGKDHLSILMMYQ